MLLQNFFPISRFWRKVREKYLRALQDFCETFSTFFSSKKSDFAFLVSATFWPSPEIENFFERNTHLAILTKLAHVITVVIMVFNPIEIFFRDTKEHFNVLHMMMRIEGMRENDDDYDSDENEVNCYWCKNVFPQWTVELLRYLHFCFERKSRFAKYSICASPPLHERFGRFCKMIFKPNISICQTSGCLILRGRNIWNYRFTRLKLGSASIDTPNFLWIPRWWISRKSFHNLTTPRQLRLQKKVRNKIQRKCSTMAFHRFKTKWSSQKLFHSLPAT